MTGPKRRLWHPSSAYIHNGLCTVCSASAWVIADPTACLQFGPHPSPLTFPAMPSNIGFVLSVWGFLFLATGHERVIRRLLAAVQIGRVFFPFAFRSVWKVFKIFYWHCRSRYYGINLISRYTIFNDILDFAICCISRYTVFRDIL